MTINVISLSVFGIKFTYTRYFIETRLALACIDNTSGHRLKILILLNPPCFYIWFTLKVKTRSICNQIDAFSEISIFPHREYIRQCKINGEVFHMTGWLMKLYRLSGVYSLEHFFRYKKRSREQRKLVQMLIKRQPSLFP